MADVKEKRGLGIPLGKNGAIVQGELTTFTDGSAKWTYIDDINPLVSGFGDRSTFTSTKDENGKWGWTPTTNTSIKNLSDKTGLTTQQINDGLYKTPAVQTVLNGQRVNLLGGTTEARKIDSSLPLVTGTETNPTTPVDQTTPDALNTFQEALKQPFNKNTRKAEEYQDVKYPLNLKLENQDCIKFSIAEYKAPGVKPGSSDAGSRIVTLSNSKPELGKGKDRKILATITLPIPAGINDRNPADWGGNELGELQRAFTNISIGAITGGGSEGAGTAGNEANRALSDSGALEAGIVSKFAELATGATNILSRQYGAVVNPNLELLFNGPSLRSFTFNFRFTPRETKEAQAVRKIIRQFKQAMSVKRSASSLLLRAPHTFAISYLSNNKDHPYLNRFKECALTDCSVSYTPDGTYMTYTDSSMTAYELSLTFQELEPIFDDDYFEIDENKDTSIGF
jgi:hypothetical protein